LGYSLSPQNGDSRSNEKKGAKKREQHKKLRKEKKNG
jgi:hypothetical protein